MEIKSTTVVYTPALGFIENSKKNKQMEKLTVQSLYNRLKAEVPYFWKQIRRIMIVCGSIGGAIAALPEKYISFLPSNTAGVLITIGVVGTTLASLTCGPGTKPENPK